MIRKGRYTRKVSTTRQAKRTGRRGWRWFRNLSKPKKILVIAGPLLAFLIATPLLTYLYYANDISDQERLMNRNNTGVVLTDRNGEAFYTVGRAAHRQLVPLSEISDNLEHAVIAAEDKDFYKHEGFSVTGIVRSFYNNIMAQEVTGGGSTLTQQLAKNTLLSENQTFLRKYQELFIAVAIEQQYTKDQILEMYLNSVFFGENSFGIDDAAKTYFGKSPKDLDIAQSAMLIGVLPAPSVYSPISGNPEYAKERQTTVLSRMVTNGYITEADKQAALAEKLTYIPQDPTNSGEAPHFAEMVMQELYDKYGEETVTRSGYQVKTTLDLTLQRQLKTNIANQMGFIQRNGGSNAGGVAIDPTTGEVRALVGSADWNNAEWGKVNMATAARQPGSTFKSIYYAAALAEGTITPATILHDKATDFGGGYKPLNADKRFRGDVTVRNAISQSLNIPSVEVMQTYGVSNSIKAAQKLGITTLDESKNYGLPLALGSAEVPLLQMTNAYAAFANQGQQYTPTIVKSINNKFGSSMFAANERPRTAISAGGAFLISSILSDNSARSPIFGSSLTIAGRTAAVKTGTTNDSRDAWTIGYTPQLAVGVWVGNNNNAAMKNGGSGMAGPIWVNTMKQALSGVTNITFNPPSGVIQKPICYGSGGLASASGTNTYNEYFLATALPKATCNTQQKQEEPKKQPEEETTTPVETPTDETTTPPTVTPPTTTPNTGTGNGNNGNSGSGNGNGNGNTTNPPVTPPITTP